MRRTFARSVFFLLALVLAHLPASVFAREGDEGAVLRRFSLTVAANDGGAGRERLVYAERDARAVAEVLAQLGGVARRDERTLVQPNAAALLAAFDELRARMLEAKRTGARTELVFYYSGHSDDGAVLLGDERVSYADLRGVLDELPADVRIAILDSCASGAFTRAKGGVRRAPFLVDASTSVQGHAFLTSSSADEAAQESERIGGSFFTHYLVSGMRGAADASGDRKVTLTEAYRYAFEETLQRTAQTQFGSQHPAYEIRLAGTGDLVLTDLRATSAELALDLDVEGRLYVWDAQRRLIVEVGKERGKRLLLALAPGRYRLELSRGAGFYIAETSATLGLPVTLEARDFREVAREATLARGVLERYETRAFSASLIPPFSTNPRERARPVLNHLGIAFFYDDPDALEGLQLSLIGAGVRASAKGLQLAGLFARTNELMGLQAAALANVARSFALGAQIAAGANWAGEGMRGLQIAGLLSFSKRIEGAQLGLAASVARELTGLQLAGLTGAGTITGLQLGLLNVARDVSGLQAGLINVATRRVHGAQLGALNYAGEADVSIAPIGVTREGGVHTQVTVSDMALPELSLRLDATYNYTFVAVAVSPYGPDSRHAWMVGGGVGVKIPVVRPFLWVDVDVGARILQELIEWEIPPRSLLMSLRVLPRYRIYQHLHVFGGITLNATHDYTGDFLRPGIRFRHEERTGGLRIGFAAGLMF